MPCGSGTAKGRVRKALSTFLSLPDPQGGEGEERRIPEPLHEYPRRETVRDFIPSFQQERKESLL